jgi:hypothetical protein
VLVKQLVKRPSLFFLNLVDFTPLMKPFRICENLSLNDSPSSMVPSQPFTGDPFL